MGSLRTLIAIAATALSVTAASAQEPAIRHVEQGPRWTPEVRSVFYTQNEGSQLIPRAWLDALRQPDGKPFLDGALARYGYLPNPGLTNSPGLPVGFTQASSSLGPMVGMTCAACHTRQLEMGGTPYRVDGAPAFADFAAFVGDLDAAVQRVLAEDAAFLAFAQQVLRTKASDPIARDILHAEVIYWSVRFHALVDGSLPKGSLSKQRGWGPTRLDAIAVIYNFVAGLDIGPPPSFLMLDNLRPGDAPVRYPFLWNVGRQDKTQWTGIAPFGNAELGLARSLIEIYGVFATFHPQPTTGTLSPLNRNYLLDNSAYVPGLQKLDAILGQLGAPIWPWPVDAALAKQGAAIFARPTEEGGCVACHGEAKGEPRPPNMDTWKTPVVDVGTDTRAWQVLLRNVKTGPMEGASVPGVAPPLRATDKALSLLTVSALGAVGDLKAEAAKHAPKKPAPKPAGGAAPKPAGQAAAGAQKPQSPPPKPNVNAYEARVLHGVWAAAPYLHNGSVPTLADLLEPPGERPKSFAVGPVYDSTRIGLAMRQKPSAFVLHTTGCDARDSGDSNCGHAYGTKLPPDDKKALLEFLKTL